MKYLVVGAEGPGFASPEEALEVLEKGILPTFDALMQLEEDEKILAGGLPIGDRALVFIAEAASNEELQRRSKWLDRRAVRARSQGSAVMCFTPFSRQRSSEQASILPLFSLGQWF